MTSTQDISTETHPRLVSDADHLQLTRLVTEITWRIDHDEAARVHELFADDGVLEVGESRLRGHEEIGDWGRTLAEEHAYPGIRHVCTNMRFVRDGEDHAVGSSLLTAYLDQGQAGAATLPFAVGEDHDRFVRTEAGWRFASRRWVPLFERAAR